MTEATVLEASYATYRIGEFVTIEDGCTIHPGCFIGNCCTIRKGTWIGEDTKIGHNVVLEGDCTIGSRCSIRNLCHITKGVTIEDDVFVGQGTMTANDRRMCHGRPGMEFKPEPILIKRGARIGANVTILGGVTIGENAVVGAGSVVTKNVAPDFVVFGVPAGFARLVKEEERI